MKKVLIVLVIFALIPLLVSCASSKKVVTGVGEGTGKTVEGVGRGTVELGKGVVGTVKGVAEATGYVLTGRGSKAKQAGGEAVEAGGTGIKGIITEPLEGLGKGLQDVDAGIKKATRSDEIK